MGLICMVIVTVFPSVVPSFALYVKVSVVVSEPLCTYWNVPLEFNVSEPLTGELTRIALNASPSGSVSLSNKVEEPESVNETVADSSTVRVSLTVRGRSFIGVTLIWKLSFVLQ